MSIRVPFTTGLLHRRDLALEPGHDRRLQHSGRWHCRLRTLTPLCLHSAFAKLSDKDPAILAGSSLRGMLRNLFEVFGAGCARYYPGRAPAHLELCAPQDACLTCRLFGFTLGDFSWASKVSIGDSWPDILPLCPAPRAKARHFIPTERGSSPPANEEGWIVFPHEVRRLQPGQIRCVEPNQSFHFHIDYLSLDPAQYALLKFAVTLAAPNLALCHKLGYAKSAGLGSCVIEIVNDTSPAPGPDLAPYLQTPAFRAFTQVRTHA